MNNLLFQAKFSAQAVGRRLAPTIVILVGVVLVLGCRHDRVGDRAADFALPNPRGGQLHYTTTGHRNLLMAFLQTQPDWSAENQSRSVVPSLMSMDHQYRSSGLDVVIIDATMLVPSAKPSGGKQAKTVSMDELLNTSYDWSLSIPLLADTNGKVARVYGVEQVPTLILVDSTGRIA